ncbi:MAG: aldehyde dehydrogenase family protein, partial [Betaproteobacteria bacterium]
MTDIQKTLSPVDGRVYVERPLATDTQIQQTLELARAAQARWQQVTLSRRAEIVGRFIDAFVARKQSIAEEISWQMGRPLAQSPGEVRGFEERAR